MMTLITERDTQLKSTVLTSYHRRLWVFDRDDGIVFLHREQVKDTHKPILWGHSSTKALRGRVRPELTVDPDTIRCDELGLKTTYIELNDRYCITWPPCDNSTKPMQRSCEQLQSVDPDTIRCDELGLKTTYTGLGCRYCITWSPCDSIVLNPCRDHVNSYNHLINL